MQGSNNSRTPAANVVAFPGPELPAFSLASVHTAGRPLPGSRNQVWLCPAYSGAQELMLYVKPRLTVRQIVAELLCAQIAAALELPCPAPFLVAIGPHHVGMPRGPALLSFGCEQVGTGSRARIVRDLDILFEAMIKTKTLDGACVLDEWAANPVRHAMDVVYDPQGAVWLIDHEAALAPGVAPDEAVSNWFADRWRERLQRHEQADMLRALRRRAGRPRAIRLPPPPEELHRLPGAAETWAEVVQFLRLRLEHLEPLLSRRALPDQGHLFDTPDLQQPSAHTGPT